MGLKKLSLSHKMGKETERGKTGQTAIRRMGVNVIKMMLILTADDSWEQ